MASRRLWWRTLPLFMLFLVLLPPLCRGKYDRQVVSFTVARLKRVYISATRTIIVDSTIKSWIAQHPIHRNCSVEVYKDKDMNRRKEACYADIDNGLWGRSCRSSWTAKENCALRCVSVACYSRIYGEDPLEEGEVDFRRGREFRTCLRRELLDENKAVK